MITADRVRSWLEAVQILQYRLVCSCLKANPDVFYNVSSVILWNEYSSSRSLLTSSMFPVRPGWLSRYSDSLRAGRSGDRIPVGVKFSAPVQTGPASHPASCTMGTGSFLGVKRPGRGADHPPPSSAEVEGRAELYLYSPSGPSWPVIGWPLPLPLPMPAVYVWTPLLAGNKNCHKL